MDIATSMKAVVSPPRDDDSTLEHYFPQHRESIRVLLIDDDGGDAAMIKTLMANSKQLDFSLVTCRSVEEGRNAIEQSEFDVALIDYWLGYETSIGFIHAFSQSQPVPCVLLTGLDTPEIRRIAFRAGVAAFLAKDGLSIQAIEGVTMAVLRRDIGLSRAV